MMKFWKTTFVILVLSIFPPTIVQAKFILPSDVYTVSKLKTVQKIAARSNKAITFIYANKNTDCGLGTSASIDLFKGLKITV